MPASHGPWQLTWRSGYIPQAWDASEKSFALYIQRPYHQHGCTEEDKTTNWPIWRPCHSKMKRTKVVRTYYKIIMACQNSPERIVQGGRERGRQKKRWEDNIQEWTGRSLANILRLDFLLLLCRHGFSLDAVWQHQRHGFLLLLCRHGFPLDAVWQHQRHGFLLLLCLIMASPLMRFDNIKDMASPLMRFDNIKDMASPLMRFDNIKDMASPLMRFDNIQDLAFRWRRLTRLGSMAMDGGWGLRSCTSTIIWVDGRMMKIHIETRFKDA